MTSTQELIRTFNYNNPRKNSITKLKSSKRISKIFLIEELKQMIATWVKKF